MINYSLIGLVMTLALLGFDVYAALKALEIIGPKSSKSDDFLPAPSQN